VQNLAAVSQSRVADLRNAIEESGGVFRSADLELMRKSQTQEMQLAKLNSEIAELRKQVFASAGISNSIQQALRARDVGEQVRRDVLKKKDESSGKKSSKPAFPDSDGNGLIFIVMATFRDRDCRNTIAGMFKWAKYPDRLRLGIFEQYNSDGPETRCMDLEKFCPDNPVCDRLDQIKVTGVDYRLAKGPTWGRHYAETLYEGEEWALQIDAHSAFVEHWDTTAIEVWRAAADITQNDRAVLSSYPPSGKGGLEPELSADFLKAQNWGTKEVTVICQNQFSGENLRHHAAGLIRMNCESSPLYTPFWGAGFSFSKGHKIVNVPMDKYTPMVFDGEEFMTGARLFTHGYDTFAPHKNIVFHFYGRKKLPPSYWSNGNVHHIRAASERRIRFLLGQKSNDGGKGAVDLAEIERFGMGSARPLEEYFVRTGVDIVNRTTINQCPDIFSGQFHLKWWGQYCSQGKLRNPLQPQRQ